MSSTSKKQKVSLSSSAAAPSAASIAARPAALTDAAFRAALRPGQFVAIGKQSSETETETGDTEYTLHRFVSLSAGGAEVVEYEPDVTAAGGYYWHWH